MKFYCSQFHMLFSLSFFVIIIIHTLYIRVGIKCSLSKTKEGEKPQQKHLLFIVQLFNLFNYSIVCIHNRFNIEFS